MRPDRCRTTGSTGPENGFTLIEILVALVIAGLGLAALMGLMSSGMRLSAGSARVLRETSLARSSLERFGADLPILPGTAAGEFSEGYRWRSEVRAADPATPPGLLRTAIVSVTVWDGNERDPGVRLTTLRLLPPSRAEDGS